MDRSLLSLGLVVGALCFCTGAGAKLFSVQLPARSIEVAAINDNGQVTGTYEDTAYIQHGFVWQPHRKVITFDAGAVSPQYTWPVTISPTGVITGRYSSGAQSGEFVRAANGTITTFTLRHARGGGDIYGMNRKGWSVGALVRTPDSVLEPFLRSPSGKVKEFTVGGAERPAIAEVVNNSETVAGVTLISDTKNHGFVRTADGTVTIFGKWHTQVQITGINDAGFIVGSAGATPTGFVRTVHGTVTKFQAPGAYWTQPWAINNSGVIVGTAVGDNKPWFGFLRAPDGTFTTVNPEGSIATDLRVINNNGMVAGVYSNADYAKFVFAGTP